MCHSGREMYEGKNIHYSPIDNKPLCSFSSKQCNQRRLNGYAFCVRHILEDPTAPFRRCAYVAKSSQQMCTQAIPLGEQRQYCNNHMQVLGMLPRRERKPKKEKDKDPKDKNNKDKDVTSSPDSIKMTFGDRLKTKKLSVSKGSTTAMLKTGDSAEDPDDPYAFHDAASEMDVQPSALNSSGPAVTSNLGMSPSISDTPIRSPHPQSHPTTPTQVRVSQEPAVGLSKAKLYPELAEKLEKVRPSIETKNSKSRARSSRTMNKLQTKIAQNKIKDKLRKSQESNHAELSPSQVSSPERVGFNALGLGSLGSVGGEVGNSPNSLVVNSGGFNTVHLQPLTLPGLGLSSVDNGASVTREDFSQLTGSPHSLTGFEHKHSTLSSQLLSPLHILPPPYPGLVSLREPNFSPTTGLSTGSSRTASVLSSPVATTLPSHGPAHRLLSSPVVSLAHPVSPHQHQQLTKQLSQSNQQKSSVLSPYSLESASSNHYPNSVVDQTLNSRLSGAVAGFPQTTAILTSKLPSVSPTPPLTSLTMSSPNMNSGLDLPPPPPYVPRTVNSSTNSCSVSTSASSSSSVLYTRLQRLKGLLTEKDAHIRLKHDLAVKLYGIYARQRITNHILVGSSMTLCPSDEDDSCDENEEIDMLPWQSDWRMISDDEDEPDADGELPPDLRTAKLGLLRARMRRQCTQTKHATRSNTSTVRANNKFTLQLIRLVKESAICATQTLSHILRKPLHWPDESRTKKNEVWKKVCLHKDDAEKQCTQMCLPYANHCSKHIMYNVDQQLFQFCTAKYADNSQCCMPVIDLCHDIPLCFPHAAKLEKTQKDEVVEVKKRPRKKTKPPALTRPPRKGKKKKKYIRPQKPMPPDKPTGDTSMPETVPMEVASLEEQPPSHNLPAPISTPLIAPAPVTTSAPHISTEERVRGIKESKQLEQALGSVDLDETLSPDFDKPFELPLEQASRLLEEQDFQEVFNKIPDEAFSDIFNMADKNGDHDVSAQETEELERALAEAYKDVRTARDTLDKLLKGAINMDELGEEATRQVAEVLASNLQGFSVDAVQQVDIPTTASSSMDLYNGPTRTSCISSQHLLTQHQQSAPMGINNLPEFGHLVTTSGRILPQQASNLASFTSSVPVTAINGINVHMVTTSSLPPSSAAFASQAVLTSVPAGYLGTPAVGQTGGTTVTQAFPESRLSHSYQSLSSVPGHILSGTQHSVAHSQLVAGHSQAGQPLPPLAGFVTGLTGIQTLQSALLLGSGDLTVAPPALLSRNLPPTQHQQVRTTMGNQSKAAASPPLPSKVQASTLHLDVNNANIQHQSAVATVTGVQIMGQSQPILAAQLASGSHPTWVQASTVQQSQCGSHQLQAVTTSYPSINGFPASGQLSFVQSMVCTNSALSPHQSSALPKFSTLTTQASGTGSQPVSQQINQITQHLKPQTSQHLSQVAQQVLSSGNMTTGQVTVNLSKRDRLPVTVGVSQLITGAASHTMTSSCGPLTGSQPDPRLVALTHSMGVVRSGSPGMPGFGTAQSPSSLPQTVTQTLPVFSTAAVPVYQPNSPGS